MDTFGNDPQYNLYFHEELGGVGVSKSRNYVDTEKLMLIK